jgi:UDP-N-acetylglucosamine pyrophosphorylase
MTSKETNREVVDFFEKKDYFDLGKDNFFFFFNSNQLNVLDLNGTIQNQSESSLFYSQLGNGESLICMQQNDIITKCRDKGIEYIYFATNDNPLAKVLDPVFIGIGSKLKNKFQILVKTIKKQYPEEKVGVFAQVNGATAVVDYSILTEEQKNEQTSDGQLKYRSANLLNYLSSVDHLSKILHSDDASKSIEDFNPVIKETVVYNQELQQYEKAKILKFEIYLDTMFKNANVLMVEVPREQEFAPIKNKEGNDTAEKCCLIMSDEYKRWARINGAVDITDDIFEIPFEYSFDGEGLESLNGVSLENVKLLTTDNY